jgi:hypothetical protein
LIPFDPHRSLSVGVPHNWTFENEHEPHAIVQKHRPVDGGFNDLPGLKGFSGGKEQTRAADIQGFANNDRAQSVCGFNLPAPDCQPQRKALAMPAIRDASHRVSRHCLAHMNRVYCGLCNSISARVATHLVVCDLQAICCSVAFFAGNRWQALAIINSIYYNSLQATPTVLIIVDADGYKPMNIDIQIERWPIARLIPRVNNPRTHSRQQIAQIAASIEEYGWTNPILVDETDEILAGHARVLAAKKLHMEVVPVIVLRHLSEAQKRALVIADNQLALNAGWDETALRAELEALREAYYSLDLLGFDDIELQRLLEAQDAAPGLCDEDAETG